MSSNEWVEITLGEIAYLNYGKSLIANVRKNGFIPVYSSSGIIGMHDKSLVEEEGIIVGRKGNIGSIFYSEKSFYCIDTAYYIRKSEVKCNINFLYYLLKNLGLDKLNEDSAVPGLNRDTAHSQSFLFPQNVETQYRISSILSALDDKIELNRQTNATLEAIAQAIFKEWFVDFNFPGATGEMVESELGMIPRGWRVGKLGEVVDVNMGQSPPGESYNQIGDGVIFFQGKAEYGFRFPVIDKFTSAPKKFAKKFDTLLSVRAPVGTINMARERCCIGRGLAAISGKNDAWSFTFYCLKNLEEHFKIYEGTGTVFGSINKTEIENIDIVVSPTEVIYSFERVVNQIDELILNTDDESTTLSTIRDTLLPKMMSGEIEV